MHDINYDEFYPPPHSGFYVIYRISDKGHNKDKTKLDNATKYHCLMNAAEVFGRDNIYVTADNCSDEMINFLRTQGFSFEQTSLGNSPSFKYILAKTVKEYKDEDIIYFLEDDYLHLPGSRELITEGRNIADYVTLYKHQSSGKVRCTVKQMGFSQMENICYGAFTLERDSFNNNDICCTCKNAQGRLQNLDKPPG